MTWARLSMVSLLVLSACSAGDEDTNRTTAAQTSGTPASTGANEPTSTTAGSMSMTGLAASSSSTGDDATSSPIIEDFGAGPTSSSTTAGESSGLVVMETSLGTIAIELFAEQAPITVENFLSYVAAGFYDGTDGQGATIFHRVIPGFVIQGGGLTESLDGKSTMPPITNEHEISGLTNDRGTLSMARTSDPDSATSQFFVNLVDNAGLDDPPGYAVFAQVVEGLDVVDAIAGVATTDVPPYSDVPVDAIIITSVTLE